MRTRQLLRSESPQIRPLPAQSAKTAPISRNERKLEIWETCVGRCILVHDGNREIAGGGFDRRKQRDVKIDKPQALRGTVNRN